MRAVPPAITHGGCCSLNPRPGQQMYGRIKRRTDSYRPLPHVSRTFYPALDTCRILCLPGRRLMGANPPRRGVTGGTATCIRQYSDWSYVCYSYLTPQFPWYLQCPTMLSDLTMWGFGGFPWQPMKIYSEQLPNNSVSHLISVHGMA